MDILPILSTLRRHKITAWLVVLEIALTCAIVCNAVFLISQRLDRIDMPSGVAEHELLQVQLADIASRPDGKARAQADLSALRAIAGVKSVSLANEVPFGNSSWNTGIKLDPTQKQETANVTEYFGADLLPTLGTQLVAGRNLRPEEMVDYDDAIQALASNDVKALPHGLIITRSLAERLWPGQSALGRVIYMGGSGHGFTVVGVIAHLVRPNNLEKGMGEYATVWPIRMTMTQGASYLIRTAPQDRERVLREALARLKALDPNRVVLKKRTLDDVRHEFFADDRAMAGILTGVCLALLIVTALGIVGLGSFWVAQRRRQIGVRRALGATRRNILNYFQTENFLLATLGIALGMALAYGINLFLMMHYELPRLPPAYFPVGALALWLIGQLAVLGPALRAAAVPPVVATRSV